MKNAFALTLAAASLILMGQGCTPPAPTPEAPAAETMEKKDGVMMDGDAAERTEPDETMKKDETMTGEGGVETMKKDEAMTGEGGVETMKKDEAMAANEGAKMMKASPTYVDYSASQADASMKEGRGVVLYFYASWCPICRAEDPKIKAWIEGSDLPVSGFRVNFDTEKDLKSKHRIPYQHTTVFLNAKGEEVERFLGPVTEVEFRAALAKAAGK